MDRARAIYERFVMTHPAVKNWIKYARFEEKNHYIISARSIYERAVEFYGEDHMDEELFIAFSKFEENQKVPEDVFVLLLLLILLWLQAFFGGVVVDMDEELFIAFSKFEENQKVPKGILVLLLLLILFWLLLCVFFFWWCCC